MRRDQPDSIKAARIRRQIAGQPAPWNLPPHWQTTTLTTTPRYLCPDLLSIRDIGEADGWRGRLVRAFFIALRKVTGV